MTPSFIHLHLHSEYSLADSTIRIPELLSRCKQLGMPAVALTDQSNLFALVKFYREAIKAGVKPLIGADVHIEHDDQSSSRLTLLCLDHGGYRSLSKLLSRGYLEGHRGDHVVLREGWLAECNSGLVVLAGRESAVAKAIADGRDSHAEAAMDHLRRHFDDRLYLELVRTGRDGETSWNQRALMLGNRHGLPALASNDVRFIEADDFGAHEARVCISSGRVLGDPKRPRFYSDQQYLTSPEEMAERFADLPGALINTVELAKRCNVELTLGKSFLPAFPVPAEHTLESWIRREAHTGLDQRLEKQTLAAGHDRASYNARLDVELDVIVRMGFPGYFLIVADFINWAKQHGIPVGPGRGSGAGSLVAWALGITDIDPLPYDLLFERFLNPERVSLPDFDIDFCMDGRDRVIQYVADAYGRDRVSQIITYGTMAAKAVVRDVGRVLGNPYGFVDGIAKLIPLTLGVSLDDALGLSDAAKKDSNVASAELIARYRDEDDVRELIDLARKLEDLTRNAGKHAGGVVIAPSPLTDFSPLYADHAAKGEQSRSVVTQFDKDDVEAVGLVKFDFLGLRTLTIIDWAVKAINVTRAEIGESPIDITALPLADKLTYQLFARGDTVAVFQFESRGMRELLKKARPDRFEDLIALVSLYRPGPMDLIPSFCARKHGQEAIEYPDPRVEPILRQTYGIMVYQEQVMQIGQILGGYSLGGADLLRRAMGKKNFEEMAKHRAKFSDGAATNGIAKVKADAIFDLMEKFAGYGFNKSHAAAYALVSYQTAWLKTHYPAQFMAAVLSSDMDNTDKVVGFLDDTRSRAINVLLPAINSSGFMFAATDARTIRYGLGAAKGVGHGAVEAIVNERQRNGVFVDLLDLCNRVDDGKLNKRVIEAMIRAGALDALGPNRASLMLQLPEVMRATEQLKREREAGQNSLFGLSSAATAKQAAEVNLPSCPEWPLARLLNGEREILGHYLSGHPVDPWREELQGLIGSDLSGLDTLFDQRRDRRGEAQMVVAGLVMAVRRRGETQAFVQLEDGRGRVEVAFFNESFGEFAALLTRDRILLIDGALREDDFSGGYSLRAKRCWDFNTVCAEQARSVSLEIDTRIPGSLKALEALLGQHRPGNTALRLNVVTACGMGRIDINGRFGVRVEPILLGELRALAGVTAVKATIERPWATNPSAA